MPITSLCPTLMVEDVARSVAFYREVLEFSFVWGLAEDSRSAVRDWPVQAPLAMALVASGQVGLSLQTRSFMAASLPRLANTKLGGSFVLYLECDDLDALCDHIGERAPFLKAPHTNSHGCRQCSVEDPDGYILTFAQRGCPFPPNPTTETAS